VWMVHWRAVNPFSACGAFGFESLAAHQLVYERVL
jgi:hypothetical protein